MTNCVNLKRTFGDVHRIEYEEGYFADRGEHARAEDPWLMIIPCQHGHICPWGGELLAACTNNRGPVAKKLVDLACTEIWQDGGDGVNVKFHVDHFAAIAAIMKPRKRRHCHLSEEQKRQLADRGKAALKKHRESMPQHASGDRRRAQADIPDTLDV